MKLLILIPMYKMMDVPCVISLLDFIQSLHDKGHQAKIITTHGFNAAKARKQLAQNAVEKEGFDYVLWIDSDHVYRAEDLYNLVERMKKENLPMLSATYTLHGCPDTAHGITENDTFRHFTQEELKKGVIDCTLVGFGFLVMTHEFLKKMWDAYKENLFILDAKENCTEDVKFCQCVLDLGERVCFDSDVKVGHIELAVRY